MILIYISNTLTALACQKLRRHIEICETFHVPILNLVDMPGFLIGSESEKTATIKFGGQLLASLYQVSIPFFTVILRRAFGVAGGGLVDNKSPNMRVAFPSGNWGSLPLEGGIEAAFKSQLASIADEQERENVRANIQRQLQAFQDPLKSAEHFDIEEIIDPRETRPLFCSWLELTYKVLAHGPLGPRVGGFKL